MNIVLINVPYKDNLGQWIPLPPNGYGGIQWYVTMILKGYLELNNKVWLLGSPSTKIKHQNIQVVDVGHPHDILDWIKENAFKENIKIIHDNTNMLFNPNLENLKCPIVSTHHLTGKPKKSNYNVFVSYAQRSQANDNNSKVIRVPVDPAYYTFSASKENYFLYLGRVSEWKGVYEAAKFSAKCGIKLVIAGPAWEKDYLEKILRDFSTNIEIIGEVGGEVRKDLISKAAAIMVFSKTTNGPWGDVWCEPGSTVVSEAAISGTPVISTDNGCLKEIVPNVGIVIPEQTLQHLTSKECIKLLNKLPSSTTVREHAIKEWHYITITQQYLDLFNIIMK